MQPTATFPTGNASEIFGGDVVKPSQWNEVVNGMVEVSDAPGLGLELVSDAASQCPFSPASRPPEATCLSWGVTFFQGHGAPRPHGVL